MKEKVTCPLCKKNKKRPLLTANGKYYHGDKVCEQEKITAAGIKERKKCKVQVVECIYIDFSNGRKDHLIGHDDGVVSKFMQWCLDNDVLSIRGPGGTAGPGVYAYIHRNEHRKKIVEFFKSEGIDVEEFTS